MFNPSGSKWSLRFVHSLHYEELTNSYLNLRLIKRYCFQSLAKTECSINSLVQYNERILIDELCDEGQSYVKLCTLRG